MTTQISSTLTQASRNWATRPYDERFLSIPSMLEHEEKKAIRSKALTLNTHEFHVAPMAGNEEKGLALVGPKGNPALPTHWAFGQMAQRAGAPAGYLRDLPAPLAADCLNYGFKARDVDQVGVLLRADDGIPFVAAMTGPTYGRVWNRTILHALNNRFGDGVTSDFRVPGEFGKRVPITKQNTTLFASDRDMFVFLADEDRRIEVPGRRAGMMGTYARGFFVWNSEVGSATLGIKTFIYDYVCCNRIVWGAENVQDYRIRHTSGAPGRWIEEVAPALEEYAQSSTRSLIDVINSAKQKKLGEKVTEFLTSKRFTKSEVAAVLVTHQQEEGRPIETLWDAVTGVTAYAKSIPYQNERVEIEERAGKLLSLAN